MSAIKDIAVFVDSGIDQRVLFDTAAHLAVVHDAHVTGIYPMSPPLAELGSQIEGVVPQPVFDNYLHEIKKMAESMEEAFVETMHKAGVTGYWTSPSGYPAEVIPDSFRYADLGIALQPKAKQTDGRRGLVNTILLNTGRPVLLVPYVGIQQPPGARILVGWDASQPATRAVHDALPILERAQAVEIVTISDAVQNDSSTLASNIPLAEHLSRHRVNVTATTLAQSDTHAGDRLINQAFEHNADLIVSGAWGHSRASEYVLGGVTRTLLETMTVPVFMSH